MIFTSFVLLKKKGCSFVFGAENGDVELKLGVPTTLYIIPNRQFAGSQEQVCQLVLGQILGHPDQRLAILPKSEWDSSHVIIFLLKREPPSRLASWCSCSNKSRFSS